MTSNNGLQNHSWPMQCELPTRDNVSVLDGYRHKLHRSFGPNVFHWWSSLTPDERHGPLSYSCYLLADNLYLVLFQKAPELGGECVATLYDYTNQAVLIFTHAASKRGNSTIMQRVDRGSLNAPLTYDMLAAHQAQDLVGSFYFSSVAVRGRERIWEFGNNGNCIVSEGQSTIRATTRGYALTRNLMLVSWKRRPAHTAGLLIMDQRNDRAVCLTVGSEALRWSVSNTFYMSY